MIIQVFKMKKGKTNVVADALSGNEWMKLRRDRAISMTIHSSIKARIMEAQSEASKDFNMPAEMLRGLDKQFERKDDDRLGPDAIWVIIDHLTKSAHFLAIREDYKMGIFARVYINEIVARNGVPMLIIFDHDSQFTS
nr:putative reverse transcriptase domain-containing protein [Tanacetum cinerariifolium]